VVMPNHFHAVVFIKPELAGQPRAVQKTDQPARNTRQPAEAGSASEQRRLTSLPRLVQAFKANATRRARQALAMSEAIWQASCWDHVIRDEAELREIRQYILNNPQAWELDRDNAARSGLHPFYEWIEARRIPASQKQN